MNTFVENSAPVQEVASRRPVYLSDLLTSVAQLWRKVAAVSAGAAVVTFLLSLLIPNRFTAVVVVLPPSSNSGSGLLSQLGSLGGLGAGAGAIAGSSLGIKNSTDLYVSLLKSRTVEDAIIDRYHLMQRYKEKRISDCRQTLEKYLTVSAGVKDGLIRITATDRDPKFSADLANGYIEEYRKFSAKMAITEAAQRRLFFQEQLRAAKDDLSNAEDSLKGTQQSTGIVAADSQLRALFEVGASLRAQLVSKQVQLQALRNYATDQNPQVRQLQEEIAAMQAQLAQFGGTNPESGILAPKKQVSDVELEYLRKTRDVRYFQTIVTLLSQQYESARIDEAREGAPLQLVDPAVIPDVKSSPHRMTLSIAIALLAALLYSAWIAVTEFRRQSANIT